MLQPAMVSSEIMERLVSIKTYSYRHEAELAQIHLEAAGLESVIRADDCGGLGVGLSFSGGVRIFVNEDDAEKAQEILSAD